MADDEPTDTAAPDDAQAEPPDTGDLRIGSFLLFPTIIVTELFDDNIFATRNNKVGDYITVISPGFRLESDWTEHALNLFGSIDVGRYAQNGSEDYVDWQAGGDGRIDISDELNVFGGGYFAQDHEPRESPDGVNGTEPTTYDEAYGFAGVAGQIDDISARIAGTVRNLDYDDVPATNGMINNDDRDRTLYDIGTRIGYEVDDGRELFVQGAGDFRSYDQPVDDGGFDRDSSGFNAALGMSFAFEDDVAAALLAGAADKTGNITVDLLAYQNSILDVNVVEGGVTTGYFDYSSFSYDRAATYAGETVSYLERTVDADGNVFYVGVTKSILDAVFGGPDGVFDPSSDNVTGSNITGFASAADDALQVIEFVHDNQIPSG